jgi:hypothetical protein
VEWVGRESVRIVTLMVLTHAEYGKDEWKDVL